MTREEMIERCDQRILKLSDLQGRMHTWRNLQAFIQIQISKCEAEATTIMEEQNMDKMIYDALHNPDTNQPTTP